MLASEPWDLAPWDLLFVRVPVGFWLLEAVDWDCTPGRSELNSANRSLGSFYIGHLINGDVGKEKGPCPWAA